MSEKSDFERIDSLLAEKCKLKFVSGKAIVECTDSEAVVGAVTSISKGVQVIQVEATMKPSVEIESKAEVKKGKRADKE